MSHVTATRRRARAPARGRAGVAVAVAVALGLGGAGDADGQARRRISAEGTEAPMADVLHAFATFSGRSIVAGRDVRGVFVTASINDQPWDVVLGAILDTHGFRAIEDESGVIRVESMATAGTDQEVEPLTTRVYRLSFLDATEARAALAGVLTDRGQVSVVASRNVVIVTDVARVHATVAGLLGGGGR